MKDSLFNDSNMGQGNDTTDDLLQQHKKRIMEQGPEEHWEDDREEEEDPSSAAEVVVEAWETPVVGRGPTSRTTPATLSSSPCCSGVIPQPTTAPMPTNSADDDVASPKVLVPTIVSSNNPIGRRVNIFLNDRQKNLDDRIQSFNHPSNPPLLHQTPTITGGRSHLLHSFDDADTNSRGDPLLHQSFRTGRSHLLRSFDETDTTSRGAPLFHQSFRGVRSHLLRSFDEADSASRGAPLLDQSVMGVRSHLVRSFDDSDTPRGDDNSRDVQGPDDAENNNGVVPNTLQQVPSRADSLFRSLSNITPVDLNLLRNLDDEYHAAALQTTAQDRAQRIWACRAGLASTLFILLYFLFAALVLLQLADNHHYDEDAASEWTPLNTALFVVYTATTVGYGHLTPPDTSAYYIFSTFNIMLGMAALAIMVAQVFMWMALEARWARDRRRATALARNGTANGGPVVVAAAGRGGTSPGRMSVLDGWRLILERCLPWFQETAMGGFLSVAMSLLVITLAGALPIGALEGWSFLQSVYFGVVSMATVGRCSGCEIHARNTMMMTMMTVTFHPAAWGFRCVLFQPPKWEFSLLRPQSCRDFLVFFVVALFSLLSLSHDFILVLGSSLPQRRIR
jgi:hypothetical protein